MKRAIKDRIDAIHQNPSSIHYIKTEIGILPCDWKIAKFSDIAEKVTQTTGTDYYETVSISAGIGFVNQAKKFGKELSGKQYEKYNVIHKGDFSYNKGNSSKYPQGCIYRLKDRETAAVPNVFESFRILSECADFYDQLFVSGYLNKQLSKKINHGVRDDGLLNLTEKDFYGCLLPVPPLAEQKKISENLDHCDKLIKLCEAKVNEYRSLKKTCLSKMFPKNGSNAPEFRFPGFKDAWEQREFSKQYVKVSEKNDLSFGIDKIISVANMYFKEDTKESSDDYMRTYNIMRLGDIAFEGNKSKNFAHGRFVENTIGDGIVSHVFDVFRPIADYDLFFWKYIINNENVMGRIMTRCTKASTMMTNLVADDFLQEKIAVPSLEEQKQIGAFLDNLDRLITLHQRESEEYTKLKKAMSQLLLTGIVRVNT